MLDRITDIYFRVMTEKGPGLVVEYYRELNYIFGMYEEKVGPDYTFIVALDSGDVVTIDGNKCKIIMEG